LEEEKRALFAASGAQEPEKSMSLTEVTTRTTAFEPVHGSLASLTGEAYAAAVCEARAALSGESAAALRKIAEESVEFFPKDCHDRLVGMLPRTGMPISAGFDASAAGATSDAFRANSNLRQAPLSGLGYFRTSEEGRLFFTAKSEHYHVSLGHDFPGYRLLDHARRLGIPNATHNNTRGHITRLLEERLANRASRGGATLDRVLNLETGSLAAEAALKLLLARFHKAQPGMPEPKYGGRIPVIAVLGDRQGGTSANYHGTTLLTQMMRGMWPEMLEALERGGALAVRAARPNDMEELDAFFKKYELPPFKIAGFFHELVMMNYGAVTLTPAFAERLYALCGQHDVPTVVDEIQTGVWSPEIFMFHEYGLRPSVVVLGKGFPGGEFAASRILFDAALDRLPQFGALVTNGQEELASLAYLITMQWAEANAGVTKAVGEYYQQRLRELGEAFPHLIVSITGCGHLAGVNFVGLDAAKAFTRHLNQAGLDISAQTYKEGCPPCALTKLPLIAGFEAVDFVVGRMRTALERIRELVEK